MRTVMRTGSLWTQTTGGIWGDVLHTCSEYIDDEIWDDVNRACFDSVHDQIAGNIGLPAAAEIN